MYKNMLLRRCGMKQEPGINTFKNKFKDYTDYYTIIGGTACDILLSEADLRKRSSKKTQINIYDQLTTYLRPFIMKCKE
jgi:hypothetical protein